MDEFALIYDILAPLAGARPDVVLGIGDDGAVVQPRPGEALVIVTDTMVSGVHFPPTLGPADIGYRALAVNLSDIAAMGAEPRWATLALTLPAADEAWVRDFAAGLHEALVGYDVALVGGDTTRGPLTITVQIVGVVPQGTALTRAGARPGDLLFVSGTLGDAALGLEMLRNHAPLDAETAYLIGRLARPTPRVALGRALRGIATSCIDVSDGLLADVGHLARASACDIRIEAAALPCSTAAHARGDALQVLRCALSGGDDYELAFTAPASHAKDVFSAAAAIGCAVTRIGRVCKGPGRVDAVDPAGHPVTTQRGGYRHFES